MALEGVIVSAGFRQACQDDFTAAGNLTAVTEQTSFDMTCFGW